MSNFYILNKFILILMVSASLNGCAKLNRIAQNNAFKDGDYNRFCSLAAEDASTDSIASYHMGMCYEMGIGGYYKNLPLAVRYYTFAARWNVQSAITKLAQLNAPIPQPDLWLDAERRDRQMMGQAISNSINNSQQGPSYQPPQQYVNPTNCTSFINGNVVQTNCY